MSYVRSVSRGPSSLSAKKFLRYYREVNTNATFRASAHAGIRSADPTPPLLKPAGSLRWSRVLWRRISFPFIYIPPPPLLLVVSPLTSEGTFVW
jgi:hypothetical protein